MPNWCTNKLIVSGSPASLAALASNLRVTDRSAPLSFERADPPPGAARSRQIGFLDEVAMNQQLAGGQEVDLEQANLVIWRLARWGTDSEPIDVRLSGRARAGSLTYDFQTAWSPPLALVRRLAETNTQCSLWISWFEPSVLGAGQERFERGALRYRTHSSNAEWHMLAALDGSPLLAALRVDLDRKPAR